MNFCYSYLINKQTYDILGYNYKLENFSQTEQGGATKKEYLKLIINSNNFSEPYSLDNIEEKGIKFKVLFSRYKKLFSVQYKSLKPPKYLIGSHYQQILKYL
jgi:hypothetical protein